MTGHARARRAPATRASPAWRAEDGFVGGAEVFPFGLLVFIIGILLLAGAWGVVDAKQAAVGAAREATRAYVEATGDPAAAAEAAAADALAAYGRTPAGIEAVAREPYGRCARVTYEVRTAVALTGLPVIDRAATTITVSGRHSEIVDPLRGGVEGVAECVRDASG